VPRLCVHLLVQHETLHSVTPQQQCLRFRSHHLYLPRMNTFFSISFERRAILLEPPYKGKLAKTAPLRPQNTRSIRPKDRRFRPRSVPVHSFHHRWRSEQMAFHPGRLRRSFRSEPLVIDLLKPQSNHLPILLSLQFRE